jgi:glycine/D-amino acid oxidase-like deaminating enzyme/nitrite reductase/ring-hydroxylating ferredoxin subunit
MAFKIVLILGGIFMDYNNTSSDVFQSNHEPYWIASTPDTNYPVLEDGVKVDVAIIGGGIVGITTAFLLKRSGVKVAVIEANKILKGTTGHTTAKVTSQHGLMYDKLINQFGREKARQYAESNESAIQLIADIIKEKNIDCDFSWKPAFIYAQTDKYIEKIVKEVEAAGSLGIKASFQKELSLPFEVKGALRFDNQAQFHPRKFLLELAKDIPGDGSYIFEGSTMVDIEETDASNIVVTRDGKRLTAEKVVIASHYPCYDRLGLYFSRIYSDRSYLLGIKVKEKIPEGMFISAESPTRSIRSTPFENGELLILGGEHHKTGHGKETNTHYENLAKFAYENYTVENILYRWSAQDCMTMDNIPFVGHLTEKTKNIYVATGFKKWGMTNGTASAMILTDLITKDSSPWSDVYNPSRFINIASVGNFAAQNLDVAVNFVADKISPAPQDAEVKKGEAKVIKMNGDKVGAYRDDQGVLHVVDITCTHLGCELHWNEAEKSWDCPCHGSRFNYDGGVIEGPAFKPLNKPGEGRNVPDPNIF